MSLTTEDLLAISQLLDTQLNTQLNTQLKPIKEDIRNIKLTLENNILPRLQNIESCYTTTYKRYQSGVDQIDMMQTDIDMLKKVVTEHSVKLQHIS